MASKIPSGGTVTRARWTNWFGNESCQPIRLERPTSEAEVQEIVTWAHAKGATVRVVGGGHSVTPIVGTDGALLDLSGLAGSIVVDEERRRAVIPAGMRLAEIFDPLWDAGYALKNMGEIDTATLAGAVSTAVHGTGLTLQCVSGAVRGMRLITASGAPLEIGDAETPELLAAAQVALGMLGVVTEITLEVIPAYELHERSFYESVSETIDRWDERLESHRHYSFYYIPNPQAATVYGGQIPPVPDERGDVAYVTVRDAFEPGSAPSGTGSMERTDRMNRILTYSFEPNFREIEIAVPLEHGQRAFLQLRDLIRARYPHYSYPIDVRFVAADDAFLSPYQGGPKAVISVADDPAGDWKRILDDCEYLLSAWGGMPHWGKLHSLTPARLKALFPHIEQFRAVRQELDPSGTFLNHHLKSLFDESSERRQRSVRPMDVRA